MAISFDPIANIYDESRSFPNFIMNKVIETLINEMREHASILDVGTGTARFSKRLQDYGLYVVGIDVSVKMLRKAVEKQVHNLAIADVCHLPFKDNSFDVTLSVGLLHLVKEWRTALWEMSRVTRKSLVSVIHKGKNPVREKYRNLLIKRGWRFPQVGIAERELEILIKPIKSIGVATYEAHVNQSLAFLEKKAYSHQWDIPEEMHRQAMQQLRKATFPRTYSEKIEVLLWDIRSMRGFLQMRKT